MGVLVSPVQASETRQITAVRIEKAPVIDGRLEEDCWKGVPQGGFIRINTGSSQADPQTKVYALFDHSNLYFGFRCEENKMEELRAIQYAGNPILPNELKNALFADSFRNAFLFDYSKGENIEVFLDPGRTGKKFIQFLVNTSGCARIRFATEDPLQLGELPWRSAVFLGESFFSVEIAIPFSILHLTPENAGSLWGVNFCRSRMFPGLTPEDRYSSWQSVQGTFCNPASFGTLAVGADLAPFELGGKLSEYESPGSPWDVFIKNFSKEKRRLLLEARINPSKGMGRTVSKNITLPGNEMTMVSTVPFQKGDEGALIELRISDAATRRILYQGISQTQECTPVFQPPENKNTSGSDDGFLIDFSDKGNLKNFYIRSLFWMDNGARNIRREEDPAKLTLSEDPRFIAEGKGALRIDFPGGLIRKHPGSYVVVSLKFHQGGMKNKDSLVFWIYNFSGGGRVDARLGTSGKGTLFAGSFLLNSPGFKRIVFKKKSMKGNQQLWNELDSLSLVGFGDFVIYLSGLRAADSGELKKCSIPVSSRYDRILPSEDITPVYPAESK